VVLRRRSGSRSDDRSRARDTTNPS
jgi:hypothetical protein